MDRDRLSPYLFVLPALALLFTFRLYPLAAGAVYALTDWDGIAAPRFIGLGNFIEIARDPVFHATMRNVAIVLVTLPVWAGLPLMLAILIHLGVPGAAFYRAVYFLPIVLSSIIIGTMFSIILRFDGSLNQFLSLVSLASVDWLGDRHYALLVVVCVAIWAHFGMNVLIYLSGLATVPAEIVEAARVDGASLRHVVFRIIIPIMRPTVEFVLVISTVTILTSMFGLIYVMTGGGPGTSTYMPEFLIWLMQGTFNRLGYASAISIVLFLVVGLLGLMQVRLMRREEA